MPSHLRIISPCCHQGLGNRLPGLVTAFALALLTDRVLLIDDAIGKFYGLFTPSFDCNYTHTRCGAGQLPAEKRSLLTRHALAGCQAMHRRSPTRLSARAR